MNSKFDSHASFAGDGVKLAFGRRWDNKLIHVSLAERGSACGCTCAGCGRKLVAYKGKEVQHHFKHAPLSEKERSTGVVPVCAHGGMTALHAYAQQLLNEKKGFVLPPVGATIGGQYIKVREAESWSFDHAQLEKKDGETIPDVILHSGDRRVHVEIFVTHRCDQKKIKKLVEADISAIEIDLSGIPRRSSLATIDDAILRTAPRRWLHNRHEKRLRQELEAEIAADELKAKERRAQRFEQFRQAYARSLDRALRGVPLAVDEINHIGGQKLEKILNEATGGEGFFSTHPTVWKAEVIRMLLAGVSPSVAAHEFKQRKWINAQLLRTGADEATLLEAGLPDGVEGAIKGFLHFLARRGIAENQVSRWTYTREHAAHIKAQEENRRRAEDERQAKARRHGDLLKTVTTIIEAAKLPENTSFNYTTWLSSRKGRGKSPGEIADLGGTDWRDFIGGLRQTLLVLKGQISPPAEDFGLPVRTTLDTLRCGYDAKKREESEGRVYALERCVNVVGTRLQEWIDVPNSRLNGKSPREAAAQSPEEFKRVKTLLEQTIDKLRLKKTWEDKLEEKAVHLFPSLEEANLAMKTRGWELPGNATPRDHVCDQKTLNECESAFKEWLRRPK